MKRELKVRSKEGCNSEMPLIARPIPMKRELKVFDPD